MLPKPITHITLKGKDEKDLSDYSPKGSKTRHYDSLLKDITDAGQLKLKVRPHHFASVKQ